MIDKAEKMQWNTSANDGFTVEIETLENIVLLNNASLPLPELNVNEQGELTYRALGRYGGSERLSSYRYCTEALFNCRFVLIDKKQKQWMLKYEEFSGLGGRFTGYMHKGSTGDECQIIIEDGMAVTQEANKKWKEGEF